MHGSRIYFWDQKLPYHYEELNINSIKNGCLIMTGHFWQYSIDLEFKK